MDPVVVVELLAPTPLRLSVLRFFLPRSKGILIPELHVLVRPGGEGAS
ncbi:MAG TPA: hypothetical protein VJP06_01205 [Thermoplasmata archaeon]|nr:hypothetical protein [Thermoplasmata archaeon]